MIRPVAAMVSLALLAAQAWAQEAPPADDAAVDASDEAVEEVTEPWPPKPSATNWATFEGQIGPLLADLKEDRLWTGNYARLPDRGSEEVVPAVAAAIRSQLTANECWSPEDMVIAGRRETIAIAVRFGVDGRFVEEPRLVSPQAMPRNDRPLQRFIRRTFAALNACNENGLTLPAKYYEDPVWVYFIVQSRPE